MSNITTTNNKPSSFDVIDKLMKMADFMAKSDIIPAHYRGKPANVFVAVQTAYRWDLDPMLVMSNTFVVSGKLGMVAAFAISLANTSGLFNGGIRYKKEGSGDSLQVTAYTTIKATNETIEFTVSMAMAKAEGWTKNSKYQTLPELMLSYRAATFLIRTHAPEVLNGLHMVEELEDVSAAAGQLKGASKADEIANLISPPVESANDSSVNDNIAKEEPQQDFFGMVEVLKELVMQYEVPRETVSKWLEKADASCFEEMPDEAVKKCIAYVKEKYA